MARFRIRTNWTNSVSQAYEFALEDLAEPGVRNKLKWAMSDPERLRREVTRQTLTANAAATSQVNQDFWTAMSRARAN